MNRRIFIFITAIIGTVVAVTFAGCIDSDNSGRPEEASSTTFPVDEGSRPFSCDQDAEVTQLVFDDFEFGSINGNWYANNEVCEECQTLKEARDEKQKELNLLLYGDSEADTDTASDTATETEAAIEDSEDVKETEIPLTPEEAALTEEIDVLDSRLAICTIQCTEVASPNFFTNPVPAATIFPAPRCDSKFAIHFTAEGLVDWGANLGKTFAVATNATQYDGISFWARRANYSHGVMRVEVSDQYTEPGKDTDENGDDIAQCTHDHDEDNPEVGCDRYGNFVQLSTDWKFFKLPFEDMRQAGWGAQVPPLDTQTLWSVTFLFLPGTWDMWLDDVAFYAEGN